MSADKFLGKTKKDLIVIAALGKVLSPSAASRMRKEDLIQFLIDAEAKANNESSRSEEKAAVKSSDSKISKTTKASSSVKKEAASVGDKDESGKDDGKDKRTASSRKIVGKTKAKAGADADTEADEKAKAEAQAQIDEVEKKESKEESIHLKTGETEISKETEKIEQTSEKDSKDTAPKKVKSRRKKSGTNVNKVAETKNAKSDSIKAKADEKAETTGDGDKKSSDDDSHETVAAKKTSDKRTKKTGGVKKDETEPEEIEESEVTAEEEPAEILEGILEVMSDGYGFLRKENYLQSHRDIYVSPQLVRRYNLRTGDQVVGPGKFQKDNDKYKALLSIQEVNGQDPENMLKRPNFDRLTPIYPNERFVLETTRNELSTRIIDLIAPIGKGQRGMIVSPPKAGKTILLQKIANAIAHNNPDTKLIVLLIDERPEEVTDMQRSIKGEVVYSTFDKTPENHVKIVELVLERAMRLVELGEDVVILLDSITRLGRAYNLTINPTGRTLSGGLDPGALYGPKRFFGAARNIEHGGSLTIIATSLIETGSRMDEVIFEEFKGTGNMEVYLDRKLSEKRIFPAIDINRSGTRREELLLERDELDAVWTIRKAFGQLDTAAVTEMIINLLLKTNRNKQFISSINVSMNDKALFDAMRGVKPGGGGSGSSGGQGFQGENSNTYY